MDQVGVKYKMAGIWFELRLLSGVFGEDVEDVTGGTGDVAGPLAEAAVFVDGIDPFSEGRRVFVWGGGRRVF